MSSMSTTNSIRGRCAGSEPRLVRRFSAPCSSRGRSRLIRYRLIARRRLLDVFEAEQHLIFEQRLSPAAKTMPLQFLDELAQPLVPHPLGEQHRRFRD